MPITVGMVEGNILHEDEDDGDDEMDTELIPLVRPQWFRKIILKWQDFINSEKVDYDFLCYSSPELVLESNSHRFRKDILHVFRPKRCPMTIETDLYCDIMVTAAYVRRIELRYASQYRREEYSTELQFHQL